MLIVANLVVGLMTTHDCRSVVEMNKFKLAGFKLLLNFGASILLF